jgi:sec-independent protein translocase protein TatB
MIDLGFSKLALIGAVALVVIGPEKLPKVARMAGSLLGRAQRYLNEVKAEVSREIELDELRKMQKNVQEAAGHVEKSVADVRHSVRSAWHDDDALSHPLLETPTPDQQIVKAKNFRKKKVSHISSVPAWYKRKNIHKTRVISAAARVARYSPAGGKKSSPFFS